jgi:hypothetical protein
MILRGSRDSKPGRHKSPARSKPNAPGDIVAVAASGRVLQGAGDFRIGRFRRSCRGSRGRGNTWRCRLHLADATDHECRAGACTGQDRVLPRRRVCACSAGPLCLCACALAGRALAGISAPPDKVMPVTNTAPKYCRIRLIDADHGLARSYGLY